MKRPLIQRSFILSYIAVAVVSLASGIVLVNMPEISAHSNKTATATTTSTTQNCQSGTTVQVATLSDEDIAIFGKNASAYIVHNAQAKDFKILLSAKEISRAGNGGIVSFTYGFQNLNNFAYGDGKDGTITLDWKNNNQSQRLIFDHRNVSVASGKYWYQSKQGSVLDYTTNIKALMLNGGTDGLAHPQSCISQAINLNEQFTTPVPTPFSVKLKHGFNTVVAPNSDVLGTSTITDAGMTIFDFNRLGQKTWRSTAAGSSIPYFFNQIGYYVYNPGVEITLSLTVNPASHAVSNEELIKVRRGWNILSVSQVNAGQSLGDIQLNVLNKGAVNACVEDGCFTQTTLRDLLPGDPSTSRGYGTLFEIIDGNTTDPNAAFKTVKVDSTNIDTVMIPAGTPFWFYLFE